MGEEPQTQRDADEERLRGDAALERLRGEMNTYLARLEGKIDLMAAVKTADHAALEAKVTEAQYAFEHNTVAVRALHDRLDKYPHPKVVVKMVSTLQRMLWLGAGVALGAGVVGGASGAALVERLFG